MLTAVDGVSGSLFPGRYLADRLIRDLSPDLGAPAFVKTRHELRRWWLGVTRVCGPASGLRTLFDLVAMPLAAHLGYRARAAAFEPARAIARLESPDGSAVPLILRPWAARPSSAWRDAARAAREMNASWVLLLSPPHLSLVDGRGHGRRRAVEFDLHRTLDSPGLDVLVALLRSRTLGERDGEELVRLLALASRFQDRVRTDLQHGVVTALRALSDVVDGGRRNVGALDEALTLVYRVLFLLFAESRALVPRTNPVYARSYCVSTLCREAMDGEVAGLWDAAAAVTRLSRRGCRSDTLIVEPFNGRLFARSAAPTLERRWRPRGAPTGPTRGDRAWQTTLVALGSRRGSSGREEISYRDLGVEQLGAVYERVLDLDRDDLLPPGESAPGSRPGDRTERRTPGHRHSERRKQSGTFYTPQALADFVVRRTLTPLVRERSADEILRLRVVDPAMGSGAFLVSACRFLADAYQRALVHDGGLAEVDIDDTTRAAARRLVAERCLAGVDANPVAVQLARLSLWLTSLAHGKPLGFLDHRLRVGNSLVGAWPDDLRRTSGHRLQDTLPLLEAAGLGEPLERAARVLEDLSARPDDTVATVRDKERAWHRLTAPGSPLEPVRTALSLWCARWFWPEDLTGPLGRPPAPAELRAAIDALLERGPSPNADALARWCRAAADLGQRHGFFHWPIEFADVFYPGPGETAAATGFDAVIGNPPWEMLRDDSGQRRCSPAEGPRRRTRSGLTRFLRDSGCYRRSGSGHVNLYQPFTERAIALTRRGGRIGLVLPWGCAVDDGAAALRAQLLDTHGIDTVVGLDNARGLFPIHRGYRFLVLVAGRDTPRSRIHARFGVNSVDQLDELPGGDERDDSAFPVRLTLDALGEAGGSTRRIPDIRQPGDLELVRLLHRRFPRVGDPEGWAASFGRELNATDDRGAFGPTGLPVLEGKHIVPFRTTEGDATHRIEPDAARRLLPGGAYERPRLAYRDVSAATNRLSLIAGVIPAGVVTTHTLFCLRGARPLDAQYFLCALFNSYVLNAIVRQLMGSHVTTSLVEDLPAPPWSGTPMQRRLSRLARRLASRRADGVEPRLQALVAHLYGLDRTAFGRVLEMFPLIEAGRRSRAMKEFEDHRPNLSHRL